MAEEPRMWLEWLSHTLRASTHSPVGERRRRIESEPHVGPDERSRTGAAVLDLDGMPERHRELEPSDPSRR